MNQETIKQARDKANRLKKELTDLKGEMASYKEMATENAGDHEAHIAKLKMDIALQDAMIITERGLHDDFRKEVKPAIHAAESLQKTDDGEYIVPGLKMSVIMDDFSIHDGCFIDNISEGEFQVYIKEGNNVREIGSLRAVFADPSKAKAARVELLQKELDEAKEA